MEFSFPFETHVVPVDDLRVECLRSLDETIDAFGRVGSMFASNLYDFEPDMLVCAKGMTSAYAPIGALLVAEKLFEPFKHGTEIFPHGYTYSGHPVSAAVALANLDIFDEEVPTYKVSLGFTAIGLCMMQHVKYISPTSSTNLAKFLLDGKTYAEPSKEAFIERLTLLGRLLLKSEPVTVKDFKLSNSHMDHKRAI
mgnify:CR=1 FL=1